MMIAIRLEEEGVGVRATFYIRSGLKLQGKYLENNGNKRLFCEKIRDIKSELRLSRLKEEDAANCIRGFMLLKTIYAMSECSSNYSGIWIAENVYYHQSILQIFLTSVGL